MSSQLTAAEKKIEALKSEPFLIKISHSHEDFIVNGKTPTTIETAIRKIQERDGRIHPAHQINLYTTAIKNSTVVFIPKNGRILFTCEAGINRSQLSAHVFFEIHGHHGIRVLAPHGAKSGSDPFINELPIVSDDGFVIPGVYSYTFLPKKETNNSDLFYKKTELNSRYCRLNEDFICYCARSSKTRDCTCLLYQPTDYYHNVNNVLTDRGSDAFKDRDNLRLNFDLKLINMIRSGITLVLYNKSFSIVIDRIVEVAEKYNLSLDLVDIHPFVCDDFIVKNDEAIVDNFIKLFPQIFSIGRTAESITPPTTSSINLPDVLESIPVNSANFPSVVIKSDLNPETPEDKEIVPIEDLVTEARELGMKGPIALRLNENGIIKNPFQIPLDVTLDTLIVDDNGFANCQIIRAVITKRAPRDYQSRILPTHGVTGSADPVFIDLPKVDQQGYYKPTRYEFCGLPSKPSSAFATITGQDSYHLRWHENLIEKYNPNPKLGEEFRFRDAWTARQTLRRTLRAKWIDLIEKGVTIICSHRAFSVLIFRLIEIARETKQSLHKIKFILLHIPVNYAGLEGDRPQKFADIISANVAFYNSLRP